MMWLRNGVFLAVGVVILSALLAAPPALAEGDHSSQDVFNLTTSRPSASSGSAKRLSDLVNACTAGRGSLVGVNPGLTQTGTGIGSGGGGLNRFPPTGGVTPPGGGTSPPPGGGGSAQALFNTKCMVCHGRNNIRIDPVKAVAFLNGTATPPAPMTAVIAGLSAQEKQQLSAFISGGGVRPFASALGAR